MKILIIARGYPTPNHPLFGCFEATQAHALQKQGHEVIYNGLNFYSAKNWDIIGTNHRIVDGINIYELYFKNMKFIVALGVEICIIKLFDFLNLKFSIVTWRFIWTLEKN